MEKEFLYVIEDGKREYPNFETKDKMINLMNELISEENPYVRYSPSAHYSAYDRAEGYLFIEHPDDEEDEYGVHEILSMDSRGATFRASVAAFRKLCEQVGIKLTVIREKTLELGRSSG